MKQPKKQQGDWAMLRNVWPLDENPTLKKLIDEVAVLVRPHEIGDIFTAFVAVLGVAFAEDSPAKIKEYGGEFADAVIQYALWVRREAESKKQQKE